MRTLTAATLACRAGLAAWLLFSVACAAKAPPPPAPGALSYPDFVFPGAPEATDTATTERQHGAWLWLQGGDLRLAEREFTAILKTHPQFAPAESGLAYISLARRQPDQALTRFNAALLHLPSYAPALAGRAQALLASDATPMRSRASKLPRRRTPRSSSDPVSRCSASGAARRTASPPHGAPPSRGGSTRRVRRTHNHRPLPESAFLYRELAAVEQRAGDSAKALEHLRQAVSLDPLRREGSGPPWRRVDGEQ